MNMNNTIQQLSIIPEEDRDFILEQLTNSTETDKSIITIDEIYLLLMLLGAKLK